MSEKIHLTSFIPEEMSGRRLDQALADLFPDYSRARLQTWIKSGHVLLNGATASRPRDKVLGGEQVEINATLEAEVSFAPQAIDLNIVFEDEHILLINKPAGLVTHPAAGNRDMTLLNALLHHCPSLQTIPRAGIVHRLDKDTTGLLVIAKTLSAHTALVNAMQARDIKRHYECIVAGIITAGSTVDAPIGRHKTARIKMAVVPSGKPAVTHYRVLERFPAHTHLSVQLETGRTHQIRVHMAHIRHPIIGDPVYSGRPRLPKGASDALREQLQGFKRQALHAKTLELSHPATGERLSWTVECPEDMQNLLKSLRESA